MPARLQGLSSGEPGSCFTESTGGRSMVVTCTLFGLPEDFDLLMLSLGAGTGAVLAGALGLSTESPQSVSEPVSDWPGLRTRGSVV